MKAADEVAILRLVEEALELKGKARGAWFAALRERDAALADEVEALVRADAEARMKFATGMVWSAVKGDAVPERLGPYRIERPLGEGGMGRVLLARRYEADFEQKVAIKLIHPTLAREDQAVRFREERRILAGLRHPNIAQLIDAGLTEEGQPFFVMEYVEGVSVTDFITETTPLSELLRLFVRIGRAVQFAHSRLIIHRDIKPFNILVTADGIPKLLDFGIARAVGGAELRSEGKGDRLSATPAYASPEQLERLPLTTASDIYSLGALLFEMATGCNAFDEEGVERTELRRAVLEDDPPPPSETGLGPVRGIGRDLDAIVLKAMRKPPEQRYESVGQFIDDVESCLAGRPVAARGGGWRYLAGNFARRHAWAVSASATALVTLIVALVAIALLYGEAQEAREHAERRYAQVRELAGTMLFDIYDEMAVSPGSTAARGLLAETAQRYLESLAADPDAPPDVRLEAGRGFRRLGDLFANPVLSNLSRIEEGRAAYDEADRILTALAERFPGRADIVLEQGMLALSRAQIAANLDEDLDAALEYSRQAEALFAGMPDAAAESAEARLGAMRARAERGMVLMWNGDYAAAAALLEQVDTEMAALLESASPPIRVRIGRYRVDALRNLGDARYYNGDITGSAPAYRAAVPIYEAVLENEPRDTDALGDKVVIQWSLGGAYFDLGRLEESASALAIAAETSRLLQTLDPNDANARRMGLVVASQRALTLSELGRHREAIAIAREGIALRRERLAAEPGLAASHRDLAAGLRPLGDIYFSAGNRDSACAAYREAWASWVTIERRWGLNSVDAGPERARVESGISRTC